jgi:hypothetical protein
MDAVINALFLILDPKQRWMRLLCVEVLLTLILLHSMMTGFEDVVFSSLAVLFTILS